jgi:hypothetical protein
MNQLDIDLCKSYVSLKLLYDNTASKSVFVWNIRKSKWRRKKCKKIAKMLSEELRNVIITVTFSSRWDIATFRANKFEVIELSNEEDKDYKFY